MTGFLRLMLLPVVVTGWLLSLMPGARADSISFTDSWKDSAQTSGGKTTVVSVDSGTFNLALTVPGLGSLSTSQLSELVVSASFGDLMLPGDFTNSPTTSISGLSSEQMELNNSGQPVVVGNVTISRSGNVATITGSVKNPSNARPFPIFADQFLGSNGPIVSQRIASVAISGPLSFNLQKIIYITGKGTVIQDSQHDNLNSVSVSGSANFTPPNVTFVSPGSVVSNELVDAFLLIKDTGTVTNVQFSVNGGSLQAGSQASSNIWTGVLDLAPGNNSVSAYVMDADGYAATNTITVNRKFFATLTVNVSGGGTLKPNLANASLALGDSYTMKATAAKGFAFYYWNAGGTMTTNPVLNFTMTSGLVITAYFKDISPPVVTITSPKANQKVSVSPVTFTGTAADNVGVDLVAVRLNGGDWLNVSGTTSWNLSLPIPPGNNTIQAYAMDTTGNISKTNTVKFIGNVPPDWAPLSLAGSTLLVTPNDGDPLTLSFGANNTSFSQTDVLTNNNSGIGTFGYLQMATNQARFAITFDSPPGVSNSVPENFGLNFTGLNEGTISNLDSAMDIGTFSIETATNFVPATWSSHTITAVDASGQSTNVVKFTSKTALTDDTTKIGTYEVTPASPIGAMLGINYTSSTNVTYLQLTFTSKTSGHFEVTDFDNLGNFIDSDLGTFTFK